MIHSVQSAAGRCLLAAGGSPCIHCLEQRLREATIGLGEAPVSVDAGVLPLSWRAVLRERVTGAATVLVQTRDEVVRHLLMAVPGCACANRSAADGGAAAEPLAALLDPLFGIAKADRVARRDVEPGLSCDAVIGTVRVPPEERPTRALGWGLDNASAAAAFVGEAVERYAAFRPTPSRLLTARVRDVPGGRGLLEGLSGFDAEQARASGYAVPALNAELQWLEGRRLADGAPGWVPAAAVHLRRAPGEPRFAPMQSIGLAAHTASEQAARHARLEVLERLALSRCWHQRQLGRRLPLQVLQGAGAELLAAVRAQGRQVQLCCLSPERSIPVVLALVAGTGHPWICFGSAARLSLAAAACSALGEAALLWDHAPRGTMPADVLPLVATPKDHLLHHASAGAQHHWLQAVSDRPWARDFGNDGDADDGRLRAEVLAAAPMATEVELASPDVAAQGYHVVKVVAPGVPFLQFGRIGAPGRHLAVAGWAPRGEIHPFA